MTRRTCCSFTFPRREAFAKLFPRTTFYALGTLIRPRLPCALHPRIIAHSPCAPTRYLATAIMPPRTKKTAVNPAEGDGPKPEADIAPTNDTKRKRTTKPAVKDDSSDAEPSKPKKPRAAKKPKVDPFHADTLAAHPPRIGTTTSVPMTHIIGAHTSTSGGPEFALVNASELGANALAMFLKNQRRWESKGFDEASVECWKRMMKAREEGGESRSSGRYIKRY